MFINVRLKNLLVIGIRLNLTALVVLLGSNAFGQSNEVQGKVIFQLNPGATIIQLVGNHPSLGLESFEELFPSIRLYMASFSHSYSLDSCLTELRSDTLISFCQPNHTFPESNATPNDPDYGQQYALLKVEAPDAWNITTGGTTADGDRIVVAVLDDGFDLNHEDINYWTNEGEVPNNELDDDGNGYTDDYKGWNAITSDGAVDLAPHGTHVSGIVGALGNNSYGVSGINWNVSILPIEALHGSSDEAAAIRAFRYVKDCRELYNSTAGEAGAFVVVINASWSFGIEFEASDLPGLCAVIEEVGSVGILTCVAINNYNCELGEPCGFNGPILNSVPAMCSSSYIIATTNTTPSDALYNPSSFNQDGAPWSTSYVDLAAPGVDILSTFPDNSYDTMTGTSQASPLTAGTVALMYASACPELLAEYKQHPAETALYMREKLLGSTDPVSSLLGFIAHGRLNANRALHSIADHFHNDIYLTGMAEAQQLVNAIDHIQAADYSVNPPYSGSFTAGESIVLYPTTIIEVDEGTSHSFIVNPDMFNCAYAYPPLSVDCIAPDYAYCDSWIYCNAAPFGGTGPYTYTWYSRLGGSSEWTTWGVTGNLMIFASNYSESFWVRVKVTDGEGVSAMSNEEFVVCIDGFIPDGTGDKNSPEWS